MNAEWIKSPTGRRVVAHWADPRPAWLWSRDGTALLWRNRAAQHFASKFKKGEFRPGAELVPIKGQIARLIRLGSQGRSSLARVQFLAGGKPIATTCSCTPLTLEDGEAGLLLVAVDPVEADVLAAIAEMPADAMTESILPAGSSYLLVEGDRSAADLAEAEQAMRIAAGPKGEVLLIANATTDAPKGSSDADGVATADVNDYGDRPDTPEPFLPLGLSTEPPVEEPGPPAEPVEAPWVEPSPSSTMGGSGSLSSLFDRLAEDEGLYGALSEADEVLGAPAAFPGRDEVPTTIEPTTTGPEPAAEPLTSVTAPAATAAPGIGNDDLIAAVIAYADDPETADGERGEPLRRTHWMITGRGFRLSQPTPPSSTEDAVTVTAQASTADAAGGTSGGDAPVEGPEALPDSHEAAAAAASVPTLDVASDAESAERVTRYNFEELSRILTDRVGAEPPSGASSRQATRDQGSASAGVINLNAETLVLNRLPLAILVFRDQQVLFGNRALIDMLGHESVESLRAAGIASIFPTPEMASAGPVTRLVRRDGAPLPVIARLQSVSWQGRAALMLSANASETPRGHEAAVRAFAEMAAEVREEGFLLADRAGKIAQLSGHGAVLLGQPQDDAVGQPIARLVGKADIDALQVFLEKPARFAETARPSLLATSRDGNADIALFAEGQAGVVSGYFGFIKKRTRAVTVATATDDQLEPSMLSRLSRGIRRPLNTIIGFADLIRSAAIGAVDQQKYAEYARDIRTAGLEIAVLVDELEDFTRLRDGRYAARPSDVDLGALLDSCVVRVRSQAAAARVLVRSAISQQLPHIRADRASLGQALLNLLASAIDQTPIGGSVILSAQSDDDGGVAIHIRDGADSVTDLVERFVVFRDGVDKDGEQLQPIRSSVGLAVTRSLLAVNACSLSVDPTAGTGTLFTMGIPADLVDRSHSAS